MTGSPNLLATRFAQNFCGSIEPDHSYGVHAIVKSFGEPILLCFLQP